MVGPTVTAVLVCAVGSRIGEALAAREVTVLGRAADPEAAVSLVAQRRPDVVVVQFDAAQPAAVDTVVAGAPDTPVLAVSDDDAHGPVLAAVRAGAAGVLVWTAGASELADAVRRTAAGGAVFSPGLADVVLAAQGGPGAVRLTDRETEVLRLVVDGLTARQVAARLVLSPRTVENHVQQMLRKLALSNRAALVRHAIEHGLA